jgi:hypothetical protein
MCTSKNQLVIIALPIFLKFVVIVVISQKIVFFDCKRARVEAILVTEGVGLRLKGP